MDCTFACWARGTSYGIAPGADDREYKSIYLAAQQPAEAVVAYIVHVTAKQRTFVSMNKSILTNRKMKNFVMDTLAVLIVSCLCLLQPQIIDAYPDHWLHEEIEASVCAYHVPRRPKDLSSLSTYHEDIIDDALGTSVKAELDGEIVEALCPGQLHTFEASPPGSAIVLAWYTSTPPCHSSLVMLAWFPYPGLGLCTLS